MNLITEPFIYPFRGNGVSMLITGAVLSLIATVAGFGGIFGALASLFFAGYFCATYFSIVETSAVGHKEAPMFPDVSNVMEDLIFPFLKMLVIIAISFLPAIVYVFSTGKSDGIYEILVLLGIVYLPMAALAVIVLGNLSVASPLTVIPSIINAGGSYWIVILLLFVVYGLERILGEALSGIPIVSAIIMGLVGMYVLMVSARALGCLYQKKSEKLAWL